MSNRQQRRATQDKKTGIQLTPEQQAQAEAEEGMLKFIEKNGMEAMIEKQIQWKIDDIKAKIPAAGNVKAWFETAYELADLRDKGFSVFPDNVPQESTISAFNLFKVQLYKDILEVYESLTPAYFGIEEFVNPFSELWEQYENKRDSIQSSLDELYAWTYLEDPVLWASGLNSMVVQHNASKEFEEEAE